MAGATDQAARPAQGMLRWTSSHARPEAAQRSPYMYDRLQLGLMVPRGQVASFWAPFGGQMSRQTRDALLLLLLDITSEASPPQSPQSGGLASIKTFQPI